MKARRTILSVPGHLEKMHYKAADSAADCIMLDLEDSVPIDKKDDAVLKVIKSLNDVDWHGKSISVRVNHPETPYCYRDIIQIIELSDSVIDSIVLPKTDHERDVHFAERLIYGVSAMKGITRPIALEASIESPTGLARVNEIAASSPRLHALIFGIADYQAALGAKLISVSGHGENEEQVYPGYRWNYVISRIVNAAKAHGLEAVDAPYGNFKDDEGLTRAAAISIALGMDAKWAIHPNQIDIINKAFAPSPEEIKIAEAVIAAHWEARSRGLGSVQLDGRMIDHATISLAEKTIEKSKVFGLKKLT